MPPCHEYNPAPPTMPSPPDPSRVYVLRDVAGGDLAPAFLDFYHRSHFNYQMQPQPDGSTHVVSGPPPNADDSIILTDGQVEAIRLDSEVQTTTSLIIRRLIHSRVRDYINRLNCNEEGCFKDAGSDVTPTHKFTDQSYALGHFTIYWEAECNVGPRRCELDLPNCAPGKGSEAEYELKIYWRLFDIYDFTGWQNIIPFSWTGTDFNVYGEWKTTHTGTVTTCSDPQDEYGSISCQENISISTFYDIMYAIVSIDAACPQPNEESVVDSAMGRLLGDGKQWCGYRTCRGEDINCEPITSDVHIELGGLSTERINERLKKCMIRVNVSADIRCRCLSWSELPFPKPDEVIKQRSGTSDKLLKKIKKKCSKKDGKKSSLRKKKDGKKSHKKRGRDKQK